jgi:hypothetical protein
MRSNFFTLIILFVFCLPFTFGGCGDASDFLPDPYSEFQGVVVDDLNDDGVLDIAVAMDSWDPDSGTTYYATVIPNDSNSPGDFFPADLYRVTTDCCIGPIASGDLNDDGFPDIVIANHPSIFILFQDSTTPGHFLTPVTIFVGRYIEYLAIGDLNEDGYNDIAIAGYRDANLSILFQDATIPGNFLPLESLGITSLSVAIADIDGDFINDLAVVGDGNVQLLFQNSVAPGNFSAPVILNAGNAPVDVKIGDLDKDGSPDLVVGNDNSDDGSPGGVAVLLQDAINPGEFYSAVYYSLGCRAKEVSLGDLNNDGLLDVAIASWCNGCSIIIFFQDISNIGTFLPAIDYSCEKSAFIGWGAWSIAVGDLNDDNFNEFIASEFGMVMRLQDPTAPGTFSSRITVYNPN